MSNPIPSTSQEPTRLQHTVKNAVWSTLYNGLTAVAGFVLRTVLLKTLGAEYLGFNGLLTSILQTLNVAELGFDTAIVFSMYKPFAKNDIKTINALLNLYKKIYFCVGGVILLLGVGLSPFLPKLIRGGGPSGINIFLSFYIYLVYTVVDYLFFGYKKTLLQVSQRLDIRNKIGFIFLFVQYGIQFFLLAFFKNYYFYLIVFPLATMSINVTLYVVIRKKYPLCICEGMPPKSFYKPFLKRIIGLFFTRLRTASRSYIDTIILSALLGLTIVAKYNIYVTVAVVPKIILLAIVLPAVKGSLGNFFAMENSCQRYEIFELFSFIIVWLTIFCSICFLCLCQPFVQLWMGDELKLPFLSVVLFSGLFYVQGLGAIAETIKDITGLYWENRWTPLFEICANIILDIIFVQWWGVNGVLFATLICILFITVPSDFYVIYKYCFDKKIWNFIKLFFLYTMTGVFTAFCTFKLYSIVPGSGVFHLIIGLLICVFVSNAILSVCFIRNKQFYKGVQLIREITINILKK